MSIQLTSISKIYGTQKAVNNISFEANKGEIVGFLGPNGAGKSTTMKILTGFIQPNEGTVLVSGVDVITNPIDAQKNIGYLPEHNPLYQLSKGYRQRVGLAAAILHDPEVLILDEPTTGLDPNQLVEIRELIKELGKDKTVLLSTHIMQEVEAVCDRVIIINKGKLVIDKPISELKTSNEQVIRVTFDYKLEEQFVKRLPNITSFKNTTENNWILSFESDEDMRPMIFDFAQENGLKILGLNAENKNLENLFRELTN